MTRQTSLWAWENIRDKLGPTHRGVYEVIATAHYPPTSREIEDKDVGGACPWARVGELVKEARIVYECDERKCEVTGEMALTYAIIQGAKYIPKQKVSIPNPKIRAVAINQLAMIYCHWLDRGGDALPELEKVIAWAAVKWRV